MDDFTELAIAARADLECSALDSRVVGEFAAKVGNFLRTWYSARSWGLPDPESSAQETLVHVSAHLHQFRESAGPFRAWLFQVARHRLYDELKYLRRRQEAPEEGAVVDRVGLTHLQRLAALEAFDRLSERDQALLRLTVVQGLDARMAGDELGMSHDNARRQKGRLLAALRKAVEAALE